MDLTQEELEQRMVELGKARAQQRYSRLIVLGRFSETPVGRQVRDSLYAPVLAQVTEDYKDIPKTGGMGRPRSNMRSKVRMLQNPYATPEVVVAIGCIGIVNALTERRNYDTACHTIGKMLDEELSYLQFRDELPDYWVEVEKAHRRVGIERARTMVQEYSQNYINREVYSRKDRLLVGLYILETFLKHTDICSVQTVQVAFGKQVRQRRALLATPQAAEWIDKAISWDVGLRPYLLPCYEIPAKWDSPIGGGYLTDVIPPRPLIKSASASYRKSLHSADLSQVYSALNGLQGTEWRLNDGMCHLASEIYAAETTMAGCWSGKRSRAGAPPSDVKTNTESARVYARMVAQTYEKNRSGASQRLAWAKALGVSKLYTGRSLYFAYECDFRGRMYPRTSSFSPQGDDLSVSILRFAEGQRISTERDWFWVRVGGANLYGIDKVPFADRIKWVVDNTAQIRESVRDPLGCRWWMDADKPMSFMAWAQSYVRVLDDPSTEWNVPIQVDGSNNGLQIYSFLLRDPIGGAATNCLPSPAPSDIYRTVAEVATSELVERARLGDRMASRWISVIGGSLPRQATKRTVMTLVYGSTPYACHKYTMDWWAEVSGRTGCLEFASDIYPATQYLAQVIWASIDKVVVAAQGGMDWLRECANVFSAAKADMRWTTPVGLEILQRYTKLSAYRDVSLTFGREVRAKVAYRDHTTTIDPRQQRNGVAPNVIHSFDAAIGMDVVNRMQALGHKSFRFVHDSFGTLPRGLDDLSRCIRQSYVDMFSGDCLGDLYAQWQQQLSGEFSLPVPPPQGSMEVSSVLKSDYFFA